MTLKEAIRTCLGKYATFAGRASRSEYWWFVLFVWVGVIGLFGIGLAVALLFGPRMTGDPRQISGMMVIPAILPGLFYLAMFLPSLSAHVRRFHDRGLSGWWILLISLGGLIPYAGTLISLATVVITILKGNSGANRFGPDPLRAEHSADVFA